MARINLLPWREARRKELQQQFVVMLGIVAVCAVAVWGAAHFYFTQVIDFQNQRIAFVDSKIAEVDEKIKKIQELEKEKERLLARMRAIEQLQGNRPLIVRMFDELVKALPEGVSITSIEQRETQFTIEGLAQSNARVSTFMRQLESSEWINNPDLVVIKESNAGGADKAINTFTLRFTQVIPKSNEEDGGEGA